MKILFTENFSGVQRAIERGASRGIHHAAKIGADDADDRAPVDTGELVEKITAVKVSDTRSEIRSDAEHSAIVEFGSVPHVIRPKDAKALFWPGAAHPVMEVHHPGTAPQPFMRPAADALSPRLADIVKRDVEIELKKLGGA